MSHFCLLLAALPISLVAALDGGSELAATLDTRCAIIVAAIYGVCFLVNALKAFDKVPKS